MSAYIYETYKVIQKFLQCKRTRIIFSERTSEKDEDKDKDKDGDKDKDKYKDKYKKKNF